VALALLAAPFVGGSDLLALRHELADDLGAEFRQGLRSVAGLIDLVRGIRC
jgi:hypothetical protein